MNRLLFREAQPARPRGLGAAFAGAYIALALAAYAWTTATGGLAVLWLCNGVLAAALLVLPRKQAIMVALLATSTDFLTSFYLGGNSVGLSATIATVDTAEAAVAAAVARRVCGAALDIMRPRRLVLLVLVAILPSTLVAGTVGALISHFAFGANLATQWIAWASGDFMGMVIALPAALQISRPHRFGAKTFPTPRSLAIIAAILVGTALVFVQNELHASMLLVGMALLLGTFALGPALVAVTMAGIALVAAGFTISGYGPIAADEPSDLGRRILTLQMFVMTVAVSGLIASALLAEKARAQLSLNRNLAAAREARRRADAAAASKARFLATMSHEMRTPLNGILGYARALATNAGLPADARRPVSEIGASAESLTCLISDVLDFSQLDTSRLKLEPAPTDIVELVTDVAAMARTLVGDKPLEIAVTSQSGPGALHVVDGQRLAQVVLHVVANAVKFSSAGVIDVSLSMTPREGADVCRIVVRDRGPGVPEDQLELIFLPFHQADGSSRRSHEGAGLGLAIGRNLIALMGGSMGAINCPDGGAEFFIEFEAVRAAEPSRRESDHTARVLIVDDHPINLEVARTYLTELGCDVSCCADGAEAVRAIEASTFDLVFMDVHMPEMDGLDATRLIRQLSGAGGKTPIVALTAAATADDVQACLAAGMDAHLSKPIRIERLAEAVLRYARFGDGLASAA